MAVIGTEQRQQQEDYTGKIMSHYISYITSRYLIQCHFISSNLIASQHTSFTGANIIVSCSNDVYSQRI